MPKTGNPRQPKYGPERYTTAGRGEAPVVQSYLDDAAYARRTRPPGAHLKQGFSPMGKAPVGKGGR